jgi:Histidine kinase-like ATPase domain
MRAWRGREVEDVEFKVVLFLPRDAASVPISRQVLDSCLETLGVAAGTRTDIALALSEACANVVLHAGAGQETAPSWPPRQPNRCRSPPSMAAA